MSAFFFVLAWATYLLAVIRPHMAPKPLGDFGSSAMALACFFLILSNRYYRGRPHDR